MTPAMRVERTRRNFSDEANRYDAKRDRLVRCARDLAERGNASKVSVTDITNEMGITRGLFYYYFGGKGELNEAIVESYVQDLLASIEAVYHEGESREDAVRNVVSCVHAWMFDEAGMRRPMWRVLEDMGLTDLIRQRTSDELASYFIRAGLLARYGKADDDALFYHARFVAVAIIGECHLRPDAPIDMITDAACAALRYRKRRSPQAED